MSPFDSLRVSLAVALTIGVVGGVVSFILSQVVAVELVAILLFVIVCALASSAMRRIPGTALFPTLFVALMPILLGLGAAANRPRLQLEQTTARTWLAISLGTATFAVASALSAKGADLAGSERVVLLKRERSAIDVLTIGALSIAAVNLATGEIALLSPDITTVRFTGSFGVLEKFWPIVFGVLQATMVVRLVGWRRSSASKYEVVLAGLTIVVFALTAGRAFMALSLGGWAIITLERRRTSLPVAIVALAGGVLLAGSLGYARLAAEFGETGADSALETQGLPPGPVGATLQNVTVGPRVLSRSLAVIPTDTPRRGGAFILADAANFVDPSVLRSDRWVTQEVMRRNVDLNGGQPPTLLGGFFIDFGWAGILV